MSSLASECLQIATAIGRRISQEAFWHENRCNWVGAQSSQRVGGGGRDGVTFRTLGPDLYSGTSGVALFLAELAAVAGDATLRDTAMGAIRQALSKAHSLPRATRLGLFNGGVGVALSAVRIARVLDHPGTGSAGLLLLRQCMEDGCETEEFDLMAGDAGTVAGLLTVEQMVSDSELVDFSAKLGRKLMEKATKSDAGWSWSSPSWRNYRNLTGLSHGAAGCGFAFFELHRSTGETCFRDAGHSAFQYERSHFDSAARNWPDFRDASRPQAKSRPRCLTFWCHGAPGVAMSRLRAYELLTDAASAEEAAIAMETTANSIEGALEDWTGNFSLCHGLAGNGEAVLYGSKILGCEARGLPLLSRLARYGSERFLESKDPWPCGTHTGETPNLMLGLAGIGQFYLRMANAAVPSVLLLRKQAWA